MWRIGKKKGQSDGTESRQRIAYQGRMPSARKSTTTSDQRGAEEATYRGLTPGEVLQKKSNSNNGRSRDGKSKTPMGGKMGKHNLELKKETGGVEGTLTWQIKAGRNKRRVGTSPQQKRITDSGQTEEGQ